MSGIKKIIYISLFQKLAYILLKGFVQAGYYGGKSKWPFSTMCNDDLFFPSLVSKS